MRLIRNAHKFFPGRLGGKKVPNKEGRTTGGEELAERRVNKDECFALGGGEGGIINGGGHKKKVGGGSEGKKVSTSCQEDVILFEGGGKKGGFSKYLKDQKDR